MSDHPCHTSQIAKINRAIGQLEAIKRMIEEKKYCVDIISQTRAARNAIKTVELGILETHIGACLSKACCSSDDNQKKDRIKEIMEILKKYD